MKWLVDIDFYVRLLVNSKNKFAFDPEVLTNIMMNLPTQVTSESGLNISNLVRETTYFFEKYNYSAGPNYYLFVSVWRCFEPHGVTSLKKIRALQFA